MGGTPLTTRNTNYYKHSVEHAQSHGSLYLRDSKGKLYGVREVLCEKCRNNTWKKNDWEK